MRDFGLKRCLLPVLICLSLCAAANSVSAQGRYAYPLRFTPLTTAPPLTTDMPWNVLVSYGYVDSIASTVSRDSLTNYMEGLGYSDTVKQAYKLLYAMDDYDPIRRFLFGYTSVHTKLYKIAPAFFFQEFGRLLNRVYPDSGHAAALYYPDYILDVMVTDTQSFIDTLSALSKQVVGVTASVLDTIKGRVLPVYVPQASPKTGTAPLSGTNPPIRFEYRPKSLRVTSNGDPFGKNLETIADDGTPWIKKGKEYIVMLMFRFHWEESSVNTVATLVPAYAYSTSASMYPVTNGIVEDPRDDFGFGAGLTVQQFKAALRQRIANLLTSVSIGAK